MRCLTTLFALILFALLAPAEAQVPQILNYQGKVQVGTTPFTGAGQFRFAFVDGAGTTTYWSNDGTSAGGSAPSAAVALPVVNGLYAVPLGDTTLPNMTAIPASVFTNSDVRVRVWFDDGTHGSQMLSPDQRITAVAYAMVAGTVPDGAITVAKLAPAARPKFDRQDVSNNGSINVTAFSLADVPGMTVTTKDLGGPGQYRIDFQALVNLSSGALFQAIINVNGADLPTYSLAGQGNGSGWTTLKAVATLPNLSAGSVIKVRAYSSAAGQLWFPQLFVEGIPASQIVP